MDCPQNNSNLKIPSDGLVDSIENNNSVEELPSGSSETLSSFSKPQQAQANQKDNNDIKRPSVTGKPRKTTSNVNWNIFSIIFCWIFRIICVLLILICCFCVWNRWFRYDDLKDIQGSWKVGSTNNSIIINEANIVLQQNSVLNYTLDPNAKMVYYTLGDMKGKSHYRFSPDRKQVALCENAGEGVLSTSWGDICWYFEYLSNYLEGVEWTPAAADAGQSNLSIEQQIPVDEVISKGVEDNILLTRIVTLTN